jgi:hypothetical protein
MTAEEYRSKLAEALHRAEVGGEDRAIFSTRGHPATSRPGGRGGQGVVVVDQMLNVVAPSRTGRTGNDLLHAERGQRRAQAGGEDRLARLLPVAAWASRPGGRGGQDRMCVNSPAAGTPARDRPRCPLNRYGKKESEHAESIRQ